MKRFLLNNGSEYSYEQLLASLNESDKYYLLYKQLDLYLFFVNLIKALANNAPLVLLDADLNETEIDGVNVAEINVPTKIVSTTFVNMEAVVEAVKNYTSEITIFTSGTTGQPKKVVHCVQTLMRAVRFGEKYINQVWAYAYNPTHMAGLQVFFQAFMNLNFLVNVFNKSRTEVYSLIETNRVTHMSATPTFYRLLLPFEKVYQTVQRVTLGGEKSDKKLYESIGMIFPNAKINNVYASTEAGTLFAAKGDSFQIPAAIRDKFLIQEEELLIHKSLLGQSDSFKFDGDYYHSGDLIEWVNEANGLFRFRSRKNELINVGGYKVNPGETEKVILEIEGVQQALVYGKANSILGNVLCAEVQLVEGSTLTELEIRNYLKEQLQDFKIPRRIKFVDSFSLTRTGKIKRS